MCFKCGNFVSCSNKSERDSASDNSRKNLASYCSELQGRPAMSLSYLELQNRVKCDVMDKSAKLAVIAKNGLPPGGL